MKKLLVVAVAIVILGILAYAVSSIGHKKEASVVHLGVIAGMTGQYAAVGEGYVKGFNLALEQWNGSHDLKFEATTEDDHFDSTTGLSAYKKLQEFNAPDAYAVLTTFTIDVIYDAVHTEKKPVALGFEQTEPAEDDNIFQVVPAANPVQHALGIEVRRLGYKKPVAAVSNSTSVYQNFYNGFNDGYGGNVPKFNIGSDVSDIRSQALAIVASKPDVVCLFMAPRDGALLVKEILTITTAATRPYFVFDQSIQSGLPEYQAVLGSDLAGIQGSIVSASNNAPTAEFTKQYVAKYGEQPPFGSEVGYDSFELLAKTYSKDSMQWIQNMKDARFVGADGDVYFDNAGLRVPNVYFPKVKGGEIVAD